MQFNLVKVDGQANLTLVHEGQMHVCDNTHPNFQTILDGVLAGDESVVALFDVAEGIKARFERVTDRVSLKGHKLFFDGDEVNNALTDQILQFATEGHDFRPLAKFMEKVWANPHDHSKESLYKFVEKNGLTITSDGDVIFYKGVHSDGKGGYQSKFSGNAIVDGKEYTNSKIPNYVGAVVEMPRSSVVNDPKRHCTAGLHCGTYSYAQSYSREGAMLKVVVRPEDVVSVPHDSAEKVRVCRYKVLEIIDGPVNSTYDPYEDNDFCDVRGYNLSHNTRQNYKNQKRDNRGRFVKS